MTREFLEIVGAVMAGAITAFVGIGAYYAATNQNRITATNVAADWMRDLRAWASEAIDLLAEAGYQCNEDYSAPSDVEHREAVRQCRAKLGALIDRGRFLLPNEIDGGYGSHKASAYRGFRHSALDPLVAADSILGGRADLYEFPNRKMAMNGMQREFVSFIQEILDPRGSNKAIAAILRNSLADRKKDPTLGGLLPNPTLVPQGAEGLLYTASMRYSRENR